MRASSQGLIAIGSNRELTRRAPDRRKARRRVTLEPISGARSAPSKTMRNRRLRSYWGVAPLIGARDKLSCQAALPEDSLGDREVLKVTGRLGVSAAYQLNEARFSAVRPMATPLRPLVSQGQRSTGPAQSRGADYLAPRIGGASYAASFLLPVAHFPFAPGLVAKVSPRCPILLPFLLASAALNMWRYAGYSKDRSDLMVGYYLWGGSFAVVSAGLVLLRRHARGVQVPRIGGGA